MNLKVIGSSSKGNCYILESPTGSLLLDAGVPFREIQKALNFDLSSVIGCLVTHGHNDHSKATRDVMRAGINLWCSPGTAEEIGLEYFTYSNPYRLAFADSEKQFSIGDFSVLPFDTEHDCREPLGYLIQYRPTGEKLLFLTDSYYCKYLFTGLNYLLIECNYCLDILKSNIEAGLIPEMLKNRLFESHFSLENVKGFLKANDLSQVRKIILIHLSEGNSDASRMIREVHELTGKETVVAMPGMEIPLEQFPF